MRPLFPLIVVVTSLVAKDDSPWITIRAVDGKVHSSSASMVMPGQSRSNTTCTAAADVANCNTVTTPGIPRVLAVNSTEIVNIVETETHRLKLYCEVGMFSSNCGRLIIGDKFQAQIQGTKVLVRVRRGGNMGKQATFKFKLLDMLAKQ